MRSRPSPMAAASARETMPCAASMATCARDARRSCRHSRLSKPIEAFISRIKAEGPAAKRPPHMLLEFSVRLITLLPGLMLGPFLAGCDRQKADTPHGGGAPSQWAGPRTGEERPPGRLDRSHAGTPAPVAARKHRVEGKSVYVRGERGGGRIIKKKN